MSLLEEEKRNSTFNEVNSSKLDQINLTRKTCFKLEPLRLSFFRKELEEAENEPLPKFDILNGEDDADGKDDVFSDDESLLSIPEEVDEELKLCNVKNKEDISCNNESLLSIPEEEIKTNTSCDNETLPSIPEEDVHTINNFKEDFIIKLPSTLNNVQNKLGFGGNWLVTPGKQQKQISNFLMPNINRNEQFVTPNINQNRKITASSTAKLHKFTPCFARLNTTKVKCVTPVAERMEQQQPKVQCTVKLDSLLNTPLTKRSTRSQLCCFTPLVPTNKMNSVLQEKEISKCHGNINGILQENNTKNLSGNTTTAVMDKILLVKSDNKENSSANTNKIHFCSSPESSLSNFKTITVRNITYLILNQLGRGGSSVVYECFDPVTKSTRAIKKVTLTGDTTLVAGYINEVKMLEMLQKCDRIIKMFSYENLNSEKLLLMVLEKGDADLSRILKDLSINNDHLPVYKLIYYWMEMLYAVKQIHDNDIVHSDLKPANFLQVSKGLKLIDFGIASCIQSDMTSIVRNVPVGSFNYISPEALSNDSSGTTSPKYKLSYKSDVWSLGCILYQLVYRRTPFQHIGNPYAKISAIIDPKQQIKYPDADGVPAFIINIIKSCLQHDMKLRPSVDELIRQMTDIY